MASSNLSRATGAGAGGVLEESCRVFSGRGSEICSTAFVVLLTKDGSDKSIVERKGGIVGRSVTLFEVFYCVGGPLVETLSML